MSKSIALNPTLMIITLALLVVFIVSYGAYVNMQNKEKKQEKQDLGICTMDTCGALDDVNDPVYNIKEVIGNTILLEHHLAEKRKYCKSCCCKHFLISIFYLQEAMNLAGSRISEYPNLIESIDFYKSVFSQWEKNKNSDEIRLAVFDKLRTWRRSMIDLYYFKDDYNDYDDNVQSDLIR